MSAWQWVHYFQAVGKTHFFVVHGHMEDEESCHLNKISLRERDEYFDLKLVYVIRSATVTNGYGLPLITELTTIQATPIRTIGKLRRKGNIFELYLRLTGIYRKFKILRLVECIPINSLGRKLRFHYRLSPRLALVAYLIRPVRS